MNARETLFAALRQRRDDAFDVGAWLGTTSAPADVIAAQERVLKALDAQSECELLGRHVCGHEDSAVWRVVERYGRVWAKDTDYYLAAEALGIKEPPS